MLQHDSTDCGAACLASVIRFWGGNTTIDRIRKASGTSRRGTTMLGLYQAALQSGINATGYEAEPDNIIGYDGILILHVQKGKGVEHYVVCYGLRNDNFIIWDPAEGIRFYTKSELKKMWVSRKCLGLTRGKNFRYEKDKAGDRRKWLITSLKPDRDVLLVSIFIGIAVALLSLSMAAFTRRLIDVIIPAGNIPDLITVSVLVLILLSARTVFTAARQNLLLSQGRDYNIRVVSRFFNTMLFLPLAFFDTRRTGDFVARLNDTMRIQKIVSDVAGIYIIDVLILMFTLCMIFAYSAAAGFISLISLPAIFLIVFRKNGRIISLQYEAMAGYAMNESNFIDSLKGITEIMSLNWQKPFSVRNDVIFTEFQDRVVKLGQLKIKLGLLTGLAGTVYLIAELVYASLAVIRSSLTTGELMAILSLCSSLIPSVLNLALLPLPFNEGKAAISRMFEFSVTEGEEKHTEKEDHYERTGSISCKNIAFRFPGQKLLLRDASLTVDKGKITALVGESGCGKSTLANIIMQFYPPESGTLLADGKNVLENIPAEKWRAKVGLVPQEIHIFNSTILGNIISDPSDKSINELAAIVSGNRLEYFFNRMPAGLATVVGEEGLKLSGGQKQIVAFLRVLMQKPDFVIIDEGTSGMDQETEETITGILGNMKKEMGILVITHKLNLIKTLCDCFYMLEDGVISKYETYDQLIRSKIYSG